MTIDQIVKELEYELVHNKHFNYQDKIAVEGAIRHLKELELYKTALRSMALDYIEEMRSEANWGTFDGKGEWVMWEYPPSEETVDEFCEEYLEWSS